MKYWAPTGSQHRAVHSQGYRVATSDPLWVQSVSQVHEVVRRERTEANARWKSTLPDGFGFDTDAIDPPDIGGIQARGL